MEPDCKELVTPGDLQDIKNFDELLSCLKEEDDSPLSIDDELTWLPMMEGNHEDKEEAIKESPTFRLSRGCPIRYLAQKEFTEAPPYDQSEEGKLDPIFAEAVNNYLTNFCVPHIFVAILMCPMQNILMSKGSYFSLPVNGFV